MNKNIYRICSLVLLMCVFVGCDKSDPSDFTFEFNEPGTFSSIASINEKQQTLYDKYGVHFVTSYTDVFSHFEWTNYNSLDYVPGKESSETAMLKAFNSLQEVLQDMPQAAIEAMPSYVILADSIAFDCNLVNYMNTSDTLFTRQTLLSYNASTFFALAGFGDLYNKVEVSHFKQMWAVAIIINWLKSLSEDKYPQEFFEYAVGLQGGSSYNINFSGMYFPLSVYPQYNMETYGCFDYMFRYLSTYYGYFMGDQGEIYRLSYDMYMNAYIDLACHLAHALYATEEERIYYSNHPTANGAFNEKQRLALEYAEKILGWTINK